jgi:anaerobic selenocysteine-containing dehydrogenase
VLYSSGGNFLDTLPDPALVADRLGLAPMRVHQDIVVTQQMLVEPGEVVVLLPAATRYEQRDGGTETTTERRIAFSPQIRGPRVGEARTEWEIFSDLAQRVDPDRAHLVAIASGQAIREEIARVVPLYAGIETLRATGDQVQWGGPRLCDGWDFPTPDGRAHFAPVALPDTRRPAGTFAVATRRGKQFNTLVYADVDPLTGAARDAVFMNPDDAAGLHLRSGDAVTLVSEHGRLPGRVFLAAIARGNLQVHWPEGNVLIPRGVVDRLGGVPDYNVYARVERTTP